MAKARGKLGLSRKHHQTDCSLWFRQAYVLFKSPQAATAAKHKIESFGEGQKYRQKFTVSYTNPYTNPFKTLPKDGPMRNGNQSNRSSSGGFGGSQGIGAPSAHQAGYLSNGGYRGRGGFNSRGGVSNVGGYNRGGYQQPITGGFQPSQMNSFQGPAMGGLSSYGGFQNRGGMMGGTRGGPMGMRGGRGGMGPNPMMGMPMTGMNMGGMPGTMGGMGGMGMGMSQMGAGMGMQGMRNSSISPSTVYYTTPAQTSASIAPYSGYHSSTTVYSIPSATHYQSAKTSTSFYVPPAPTATPAIGPQQPVVGSILKYDPSNIGSTGFQGSQPHYNAAFFPQQGGQSGGMGDSSWNPHGAKRTRQE